MNVAQSCPTLCDPTQSVGFSRPEYSSGQPFPSPGDLPNPGIKLRSPALQVDSLSAEPQEKPIFSLKLFKSVGKLQFWCSENSYFFHLASPVVTISPHLLYLCMCICVHVSAYTYSHCTCVYTYMLFLLTHFRVSCTPCDHLPLITPAFIS